MYRAGCNLGLQITAKENAKLITDIKATYHASTIMLVLSRHMLLKFMGLKNANLVLT